MRKKKKVIENAPPKYVVMNYKAEYFAGLRGGYPHWSSSFEEAKEFDEIEKYNYILKYESYQSPEVVYL